MYKEIKEIQRLLWKNDDIMSQEVLFELQDKVAELALTIAKREKKTSELVKDFPYLYQTK